MSSTIASFPHSRVHLPPERIQRGKSKPGARPSRFPQISTDPTAAAFERFMSWLGPDEERAGLRYESIRGRLIMMFKARRCVFAEDLADATIERVTRKLTDLTFGFSGDPALYFYGVAKKIYLEHQRKLMADLKRSPASLPIPSANPDLENKLKQLDEALSTIPKSDRELILRYYAGSGKNKVKDRRAMAEQLGLRPSALRLRVFRIRSAIKNYILRSSADTFVTLDQHPM